MTADEWNTILNAYGDCFYWKVLAYQDNCNGLVTGPYMTYYEEINKPEPDSLNVGEFANGTMFVNGKFYWYKFTAPTNGNYSFFVTASSYTCCDIFQKYFYGLSNENRLAYNKSDNGENFTIMCNLSYKQVIYIRISTKPDMIDGFRLGVAFDGHVHSYIDYIHDYEKVRYHKCYCDCGEFIYEKHEFRVMDSESAYCRKCKYAGMILPNGDILSIDDPKQLEAIIPKEDRD